MDHKGFTLMTSNLLKLSTANIENRFCSVSYSVIDTLVFLLKLRCNSYGERDMSELMYLDTRRYTHLSRLRTVGPLKSMGCVIIPQYPQTKCNLILHPATKPHASDFPILLYTLLRHVEIRISLYMIVVIKICKR